MKISLICFSQSGYRVMGKLEQTLKKEGHTLTLAAKSRYLPDSLEKPLKSWCEEQFADADALIFIGAAGIAVRAIAPFTASKKTDPAVIVVDEAGKYAISLLSGHLGGANELAERCGKILGAVPVITTATDLNGKFAVDVFAKKNNMAIYHMTAAKAVSAALLAEEPVGIYSEYPIEGELPCGIYLCDRKGKALEGRNVGKPLAVGMAVTIHRNCLPFPETAVLVPKNIWLGLGCRKGKGQEAIENMAAFALEEQCLYQDCLKGAASIDLKAEEEGILGFCRKWKLPFITYSKQELEEVPGDFTPSAFVKKVTGVDNVCERSAIRAGGSNLILKKIGANGVTAALASEDWSVEF